MEIKWQDPPELPKGNRHVPKYLSFAAELKMRPGQWSVLEDVPTSTAGNVNHAALVAFTPAGHYEATMRNVNNRTRRGDCYIRYTGPVADTDE